MEDTATAANIRLILFIVNMFYRIAKLLIFHILFIDEYDCFVH